MAPLTFKICRKNVFNLLMGPFGSDQSRHVDDFGAKKKELTILKPKKRHLDDFSMKKAITGIYL